MNDFSPLTNPKLVGHLQAQQGLMAEFLSGTLPHGLLVCGPRGIGKATFAYHLARAVLAGNNSLDMDSEHPVFRRVVAGSHADFLVVEPLFDAKKDEFANEISVEQARHIAEFLSLTPAESGWRVVIVDSIDQLNVNAANAILKILEEPPPQALLVLISHNPGMLLPTIRSRCRQVRLQPLSDRELEQVTMHILPHVPQERLEALVGLAGGAPGLMAELEAQGGQMVYGQMLEIAGELPALYSEKIHAFAEQVQAGQPHRNWKTYGWLWLRLIERAGKCAAGIRLSPLHEDEPAVLAKLAALHPAAVWAAKWQQAADQFSLAARLHLDYKQVMISFIHSLPAEGTLAFDYAA